MRALTDDDIASAFADSRARTAPALESDGPLFDCWGCGSASVYGSDVHPDARHLIDLCETCHADADDMRDDRMGDH